MLQWYFLGSRMHFSTRNNYEWLALTQSDEEYLVQVDGIDHLDTDSLEQDVE
jgi:hypothetical protein